MYASLSETPPPLVPPPSLDFADDGPAIGDAVACFIAGFEVVGLGAVGVVLGAAGAFFFLGVLSF